jgi:hypothetical protein
VMALLKWEKTLSLLGCWHAPPRWCGFQIVACWRQLGQSRREAESWKQSRGKLISWYTGRMYKRTSKRVKSAFESRGTTKDDQNLPRLLELAGACDMNRCSKVKVRSFRTRLITDNSGCNEFRTTVPVETLLGLLGLNT